MAESASKGRRWRIGDLALAAGVTVRTLHHYDQIGLLNCGERSQGDHRLYDAAAVERLYRIRALRGLGLSLEDIRRSIDSDATLTDVLRKHLWGIDQEIARMEGLRDRLRMLASAEVHAGPDDLLATLDAMSRIERQADKRQRIRKTSDSEIELKWRTAGDRLRACLEAGEEHGSAPARHAALAVRALIAEFADGDAAVIESLAHLRVVDPPNGLAGWDRDLTRYLDRALADLDKE